MIRLLLLFAFLWLCACSPAQEPPPAVPGEKGRFNDVTLTLYGLAPELSAAGERTLIQTFEKATGATIRVIPLAPSSHEGFLMLQRMAASDSLDLLTLEVIWTEAFAPYLMDLSPEFGPEADAHFPAFLASSMHNDQLLAIPLYGTVGVLFSRKDLLEAYGYAQPPKTWDDLEAIARRIVESERAKTPGMTGFVWPGRPSEGLTSFGLELQASHGGGAFIDAVTRSPNVTSPAAIAAYRRAQSWVGNLSPASVTSYQTSDAAHVFRLGLAVFLRDWITDRRRFERPNSPVRGKVVFSELPHAPGEKTGFGVLGGWLLGVARQTRHPEAASAFVRYMTSADVQAWRAKRYGTPPSMAKLYRDPEILAAQPYLAEVEPLLQRAIVRPSDVTGERYEALSRTYSLGLNSMLRGTPVQAVAPLLQQDLASLLSP